MVDVVATPGSANANSHITQQEANDLLDARGFATDWSAAALADQNRVIVWATTILNTEEWRGQRATTVQALKFPRTYLYTPEGILLSSLLIPAFLKLATAELALALLGSDRTTDADTAGIAQLKVGEIFITTNPHDRASMYPPFVRKLIAPYLAASSSQSGIQLQRI